MVILLFVLEQSPVFYSNCQLALYCDLFDNTTSATTTAMCWNAVSNYSATDPGAFFCSLPKTGKKKIRTGFVLHTMYCTPHHTVHMCMLNLHNQVQKMSITVPWTIRTSEILRILLISGFITCTCTLQCTLYIQLY